MVAGAQIFDHSRELAVFTTQSQKFHQSILNDAPIISRDTRKIPEKYYFIKKFYLKEGYQAFDFATTGDRGSC